MCKTLSTRFLALIQHHRFSIGDNRIISIILDKEGLGFKFEFYNGKTWKTCAHATISGLLLECEAHLKVGGAKP